MYGREYCKYREEITLNGNDNELLLSSFVWFDDGTMQMAFQFTCLALALHKICTIDDDLQSYSDQNTNCFLSISPCVMALVQSGTCKFNAKLDTITYLTATKIEVCSF